ncbi:hypothetical protein LguiB_020963 [Lonicera macranthoides]
MVGLVYVNPFDSDLLLMMIKDTSCSIVLLDVFHGANSLELVLFMGAKNKQLQDNRFHSSRQVQQLVTESAGHAPAILLPRVIAWKAFFTPFDSSKDVDSLVVPQHRNVVAKLLVQSAWVGFAVANTDGAATLLLTAGPVLNFEGL